MSKVLRVAATVVTVAVAVAAAIPSGGTSLLAVGAVGLGVSTTAISAGVLALNLAAGLTAKKPSTQVAGIQTEFTADTQSAIPYAIGRTATAGRIVYRRDHTSPGSTPNDRETFITILSGGGPIQSIESFTADKVAVTFDPATGNAAGDYHNYMWQKSQLGQAPEVSYLITPSADEHGSATPPTGWTTAHKLSGYAATIWTLRFDAKGKKYPQGEPAPLWVVSGAKVYDPRLDSTYPGGSGACRAYNEATYVWSENPYLHGLTWCLGRYQNGRRVLGVGAPPSGIDVAAFVEGANVANANGWKVGGVVYSTDSKWDNLKKILQAGGGEPFHLGAKISCLVNTPRVSLAIITAADIRGEVSVAATQARRDRINGVIGRYRSEDHDWEIVSASKVSVASHISEDGAERTREVDYPLVQVAAGYLPNQVAQLARYEIENSREFGPISLPVRLVWMGYKPGDCVNVDLPEVGLNGQQVLLLNRSLDPGSAVVTFTARSETAGKHPFALGQTGVAPPLPGVSAPPALPSPGATDWVILATSLSAGGTSVPALIVTGDAAGAVIDGIVFEYRVHLTGMGPDDGWIAGGVETPDTGAKEIVSVAAGTAYDVSVRYRRGLALGARLILGPATTGYYSGLTVLGLLTNEAATIAADSDGVVTSFAGVGGSFKVYDGLTDVSAGAAFSVESSTGVTIAIDAAGAYSISAMSADTATATLRAVYHDVTLDKVFSIAKSRGGAPGDGSGSGGPVVSIVAGDGQAFTFVDGAAAPLSQALHFVADRENTTGAITWLASPAVSLTITGDGNAYVALAIADFGANKQVVLTATDDTTGASDTMTIIRLDQSTAAANATRNDDGNNMIPSPINLDQATFSNGATLATIPGASGRIADHYRANLVGGSPCVVWWCAATAIPCSPGETLFYRHTVKTDVPTPDLSQPGYELFGADGSLIGPYNMPDAACTGTEAVGSWVFKSQTFTVPAGGAFIRPYVYRGTSTTGTFLIGEPYLGRGQPGATYGAPGPSPIGSGGLVANDVSTTVKAGGGGVANNQVPTPAIVDYAVSKPYELTSPPYAFPPGGLLGSLTITKDIAGSYLEISGTLVFFSTTGYIRGNLSVADTTSTDEYHGEVKAFLIFDFAATHYPFLFSFRIYGLPTGTRRYTFNFSRSDSGGTVYVNNTIIKCEERKK